MTAPRLPAGRRRTAAARGGTDGGTDGTARDSPRAPGPPPPLPPHRSGLFPPLSPSSPIQSHRLVFCTVGVFLFRSLTFVFFTLRVNETVSCSSFSGSLRVAWPPLGPLVLSRAARRRPLCGRVLCQRTRVPLLYSGLRRRAPGGRHVLAVINDAAGHGGAAVFSNYCFCFLRINAQKWDCGTLRKLHL